MEWIRFTLTAVLVELRRESAVVASRYDFVKFHFVSSNNLKYGVGCYVNILSHIHRQISDIRFIDPPRTVHQIFRQALRPWQAGRIRARDQRS